MKRFSSQSLLCTIFRDAVPTLCTLGIVSLALSSSAVQSQDELPAGVYTKAAEFAVIRDTGEEIPYEVIDGMAIHQGDIVLGTHAEVQAYGIEPLTVTPPNFNSQCSAEVQCATIDARPDRIWPNGIIPYTVSEVTSEFARLGVAEAIAEWESRTTSIRFVERTNEEGYIAFTSVSGSLCSSLLGRTGSRQPVSFTGNGASCLVHEIGHALGLNHEQNRNDRNEHITINFANLPANVVTQYSTFSGFTDVGPYDFDSVMHYSINLFAIDRSIPVILPIDPDVSLRFGTSVVPSPGDIAGIEFVYGDSTACSATMRSGNTTRWAGMNIAFDSRQATLDFSNTGLDLTSVRIDSPVFKISVAGQLVTLSKPNWVSSTSPGYFGFYGDDVAALSTLSAPDCRT